MKRIAILGSTGSIGTQALDVVRQHPDQFSISLLTANNNAELLISQAMEFKPVSVVICNGEKYSEVNDALKPKGISVHSGIEAICSLVTADNIDTVLTSMVGFSGLRPTVAAIGAGKTIALANKETLVAGGTAVMKLARSKNVSVLPVDSEHSAIFQCLLGSDGNKVAKIHLTASGGPFREWSRKDIAKAEASAALKHPKWTMGAKITIDSSTMMNKGFEMIEACHLFGVAPENINILVHPQSIIHSMVEYQDDAVIAQMNYPDMREPILFALSYPRRLPLSSRKLDFAAIGKLTFEKPDYDKFPCLALAFKAISEGGNIPCAMNAANEVAVASYLKGKLSFYGISDVISRCMADTEYIPDPTIEEIIATDRAAFERALTLIG